MKFILKLNKIELWLFFFSVTIEKKWNLFAVQLYVQIFDYTRSQRRLGFAKARWLWITQKWSMQNHQNWLQKTKMNLQVKVFFIIKLELNVSFSYKLYQCAIYISKVHNIYNVSFFIIYLYYIMKCWIIFILNFLFLLNIFN